MDYTNLVFLSNIICCYAFSAVGCLYMYGVSRKLENNKKVAARCFLLFFLSIGTAHLLLLMRNWVDPIYSIALSNAIYLLIFYFLSLGVQAWYKHAITRQKILFIFAHMCLFSLSQVMLFVYNQDSLLFRVILAYINNVTILVYTLSIGLKSYSKNNTGENIIIFTLLAMIVIIALPLITMITLSQNYPYMFLTTVMMSQNMVLFIALDALLSLFMFDQVRMHYQRSIHDELTGIHNRRYFYEQIKQLMLSRHAHGYIALIDIDLFKLMNDKFGHDIGDDAIQKLAETITESLHSDMLFGRYGGEEFILYIPIRINPTTYLEALRAKVAQIMIQADNEEMKLTISIGYSILTANNELKATIKEADLSLYRAKHAGRNCVIGWEELN